MGTALVLGVAVAAPARGETITATYLCERGVEIPATYVNAPGMTSVAVIHVEGRQITLEQERSGSGARYGWPSGGSGYIWWSKGDAATLLWRDGASGDETPVYSDCVARD